MLLLIKKKSLSLVGILEKFTVGINWKSILYGHCASKPEFSYNERNLYHLAC